MKKNIKILSFILLTIILFTSNNVLATDTTDEIYAGSCIDLDLLNLLSYIRILIDLIKVFGPVIVVIMSGVDVVRAVMANNQEDLQKNMHRIPNRLALMAILFLLPTTFDFIVANVNSENQSFACLASANQATIAEAYQKIALAKVEKAEADLTVASVSEAKNAISYVKDEDLKKSFETRLSVVSQTIVENNKVTVPELSTLVSNASQDVKQAIGTAGKAISTAYDNAVTLYAKKFVGIRYKYGAGTLNIVNNVAQGETDCSHFTTKVYSAFIPGLGYGTADAQSKWGKAVPSLSNIKPGDLIVSNQHSDGTWHHVMIYLGGDNIIEANGDENCTTARYNKGKCQVKITSMKGILSYFNNKYLIRRIVNN